ncbi:MAG: histidinol-phosphatase HisJ family protein [Clostridia bacterium]|nr:histidinol-phosphatase HisJ family protein [Clostridia bacterium]
MGFYDCHNHTNESHDSNCDINDLCLSSIGKGLSGIAVTDHCDIEYYTTTDCEGIVERSVSSAMTAQERFEGKLDILTGIELGEIVWNESLSDKIINSHELDIVIGSVHYSGASVYSVPFSRLDMSDFDMKECREYLTYYFDDVRNMVYNYDIDVLAHLTIVLRYMCGKYHHNLDISEFYPQIDDILGKIIKRGIALEVNTSSYKTVGFMPDCDILKIYREKGGELITLGSDSHNACDVASHFEEAKKLLNDLGFERAYYYKNRKPVAYTL